MMRYFLRGLLLVLPIGLTLYLIVAGVIWVDGLIPFRFPGMGIIVVMGAIVLIGYVSSLYVAKPFLHLLDYLAGQMPFANIIYTSIKDLTEAFFGEKRRFKEPVLVKMSEAGIKKMGFVTQKDLSGIGQQDMVAVYFPHSYNFSGNLFLVPAANVEYLNTNPLETMKFIVSAGVTDIPEIKKAEETL